MSIDTKRLAQIAEAFSGLNESIVHAMVYIRRMSQSSAKDIAAKFSDMSTSQWERYLKISNQSQRPIHILAAYAWLNGVSMSTFYLGSKVRTVWPGLDDDTIQLSLLLLRCNHAQFCAYISLILSSIKQIDRHTDLIATLNPTDRSPDFPAPLSIDDFADDYYNSLAIEFRKFRKQQKLTPTNMAKALNLTTSQYSRLETINDPYSIPAVAGAWLKVYFQLDDTAFLLDSMRPYRDFARYRHAQDKREALMLPLITQLKPAQIRILRESITQLSAHFS